MKKIICTLCLLIISLLLICCDNNSDTTYTEDTSAIVQQKSYTLNEIYDNGIFSDNSITPAYKRTRIFPTENVTYSVFTQWNRIYISEEDHSLSFAQLCQDSLCTHTSLPCISYAALASSEIVEANGMLYMLIEGDGEKYNKFIEYDLSAGKYSILGEFENGGQIITRLGRFIYFFIIRVDGQTESGKLLTTRLIYRYDISQNSLDKIAEVPPTETFFMPSTKKGFIYYIDSSSNLCRCDANMQNKEKLATNVTTYEIVDNDIFYLSSEPGIEYGTIYVLRTNNSTAENIYSDVTWFCVYNDILYYSLHSPINAFEWDIPMIDENGEQILKSKAISIDHGNIIYYVSLDNLNTASDILDVCSSLTTQQLYLGSTFSVLDGYIYTQLKEAYQSNSQKGLHTGIAAINIDTGVVYWIDDEYVMY